MKKFISIKLMGLALIMGFMASCDQSDQDVASIGTTERYPLATFTNVNGVTSFTEGDTMFVNVSLSRWIESDITFNLSITGDADESDIIFPETVTLPGYSSEVTIPLIINLDKIPEETETATFSISIDAVGLRYLIAPESQLPTYELEIINKNSADKLDIAFGWDTDDDHDLLLFEGTQGAWDMSGTSDNPEFINIYPTDYTDYGAQNYYIAFDPYEVHGAGCNYTVSVGFPDQTSKIFTGTIVYDDLQDSKLLEDSYNGVSGYAVLNIVQNVADADSQDDYTLTAIDPTEAK